MTVEIALVLGLLVAAMALFALEWLSVDVVTLLLLIALVVTGLLTPAEAFSGFANEIIIILGSVFVLSGALVKTGVMEWLGHAIHRLAGGSETRILSSVMALTASVSAFFSNTSATAILMPAVIDAAHKSRVSVSRLLIPLAYASILGGTCTLIGTSTNIAASGVVSRVGLEPYGLFEFTGFGVIMALVGVVYLLLIGRRLLPERRTASLTADYEVQQYLSEVSLPDESRMLGRSLRELDLSQMGIAVLAIDRDGEKLSPNPVRTLRAGDVLLVQATKEGLLQAKKSKDLTIRADRTLTDMDLSVAELGMAEAVIMPQSNLLGRTLRELKFRRRFGVSVLAIYRRGHPRPVKLGQVRLRAGDVLLLQGNEEEFLYLQGNPDLWGLTEISTEIVGKGKGLLALGALVGAVALATLNVLPLSIAFLAAALLVILSQCVTMDEAYEFIQWRLLVLIGGMTAFGVAMENTQAADYLAGLIAEWTVPWGPAATMATFALLTMLLSQPMSNAAAALVVLPIALAAAEQLDVNPRSFAVLVTLAASLSFAAPLEPACLLVYGPGGYRFRDFLISGLPLSALAIALLVFLVPLFWPLG